MLTQLQSIDTFTTFVFLWFQALYDKSWKPKNMHWVETYPEIDSTDVYRKIMNNRHHAWILEANYCLSVYNVHFKLALSTE